MTKRFRIILIITAIVLVSVMSTAIGLTAAIWDSASGGSSEYGPVVDAVNWNTWEKYFIYENASDGNSKAVIGYTGTNLGDVIFPVAGTGELPIRTIKNTVFDDTTLKELPITIYISPTISTIEAGAFANLPNLQTVVFGIMETDDGQVIKQTVNVGAYAFAGCQNLKSIVIEGSRTVNFDTTAFVGCYNLTSITKNGVEQDKSGYII